MNSQLMIHFSIENDMVKAHAIRTIVPAPNPIRMHDDNFLIFNLMDESHQAIINVLNMVWGDDWVDGDQWWKKYKRDNL